MTVRRTVLLAICLWLVASQVSAQDAVPVALTYSAPASCPTQGRFITRLRMHTQRVLLSNAADALTLQVAIVRSGHGFAGTLEVAQQGRPPGTRTFEGVDCPDVVWALALSAALSIDPQANLTVMSEDELSEADGASSTTGAANTTQDPASDAADGADGEATSRGQTGSGASQPAFGRVPPPTEAAGEAALWSIGPVLSVSFAFEPKAAVGGGVVAAVRDTSGRQLLPLEFALRLEYLGTRLTRGADPLKIDWWSANLLACPLRAGAGPTLLVCGVGQAGLIRAEGVEVEQAAAVSRGFYSVGLALWARVPLSDHWELFGVADFKLPLVDRAFALGPGLEVVSSSRPAGASVSVGALYGF